MHAERTLIVIANEAEAVFYAASGVGKGMHRLCEIRAGDASTAPVDRPSAGHHGRHAHDPQTAERRKARDRFAAQVIETAAEVWEADDFLHLVLAAPAKMLGELRDDLPDLLERHLRGDLDKDLLKIAPADLPAHFEGIVAM